MTHVELLRPGHGTVACLVWCWPDAPLAVSSAPLGGGIGERHWALNAQVLAGYDRLDPEHHLVEVAGALGLEGEGVGLLTAADVSKVATAEDAGVVVAATVGLDLPVWAAADDEQAPVAGTINIVATVPARLADAALVNAVATVTEAKTQALATLGVAGTGTASDAVCVLCPASGPAEPFGGPRSVWGAPLARATFAAVLSGGHQTRTPPA